MSNFLQQHCDHLAKMDAIANIASYGEQAIAGSFNIAECKRRSGDLSGSASVIDAIENSGFAGSDETKAAIARHRQKLSSNDPSPIDDCEVSNFNQFAGMNPALGASSRQGSQQSDMPSLMVRGWNFATAMSRYVGNGFKRSSPELLETRLAQCQACPKLENDHCKLCGCACVAENILLNKLALESEKCPLGKW